MSKAITTCLVCGEDLTYFETGRDLVCEYCGETFPANAACKNGHYICDRCHAKQAVVRIAAHCMEEASRNPMEIAVRLMNDPFVHMHGPENHVLVGSALLTAYRNAGGRLNLNEALAEIRKRGGQVPGGACGFWGCCGAAVSAGMFISIVTNATPLANEPWGLSNKMTSEALAAIGEIGGPRCCKRNAFFAIETAVHFCKKHLGVEMERPGEQVCTFCAKNKQCIGVRCPFNPANHRV